MTRDETKSRAPAGAQWLARATGWARTLLLPVFCLQFVGLEYYLRGGRALHHWALAPNAKALLLQSAALWLGLILVCGRSLVRRIGVGLLAGFVLAFQALFFIRFARFLDRRAAVSALLSWQDVAPAFYAEMPKLAAAVVLAASVEILILRAVKLPRWPKPQWALLLALLSLALVPFTVTFAAPPDLRLLDVIAALPSASPERTAIAATSVPDVRPQRAALPNVVLIVTESVRADEYCSEPRPSCPTAPEINALLPDRIGLPEMRSTASFTRLSLAALVTGRAQNIPRADLLRSPTVFDAVKAVQGQGSKPYTAYWSAHYAPMFPWEDPARSLDSFVTYDTLFEQEGKSHIADARLAEMFRERLKTLPSPFLVVLHFHDTHVLYGFDEAAAPFSPWTRTVRWETLGELRNAYRNAIHAQDHRVADAMRALKADPRWESTFVIFTSDHGEGFGEHSAIHHGQNVMDEQIHVPGWIAHGERAVTAVEAAALRANAKRFLTHLDVAPTVLDLYGLLGSKELAPHIKKMPGRSMLRLYSTPSQPAPLTNCSETFPCPFNNWGLLRGARKIESQAWDMGFQCRGLEGGREELLPLTDRECESLLEESRGHFPELPNGAPND